jgi:predicted TIM-barrel fold metal-dependent hydrolase
MPTPNADAAPPLGIIDFHSHFVDPRFPLTPLAGPPPSRRSYWEDVTRRLTDAGALIASVENDGIAARVISTPLEFVRESGGSVAQDTVRRTNDTIAELVERHPDRLYGLATVDAYSGEAGARELTRAVTQLGLRGVFVESAKGDLLPDAAEARPTLAAAAALRVPVFLHPVPDAPLRARFGRMGRLGERLARGTINSAALFALLEGGVFGEMPELRVVVTALALGGVLLAGGFGNGEWLRRDAPEFARRQVYIDTTGLHHVTIRSAVDLLGSDHVLTGTDWPVAVEPSARDRLRMAFAACGLGATDREMIARRNALRLLAPV